MINVEVEGGGNESRSNIMRKFSRRVKSSGILRRARELRFQKRSESKHVKKAQALRRIKKTGEIERMIKLGKKYEKKNSRRR